MSSPTESYLKVHYELRPSKQVERRMLIDAFQLLAQSGFSIRDYQYTGMGSIYFVDFSLMHRLLGIDRLLSVEYSQKVRKRVHFNKPFNSVDIKIAPIGDVIPTLSPDLMHILWLDYDGVLQNGHLQDAMLATTYLSVGSFLLITVDVEPPDETAKPAGWREWFSEQGGEYFDDAWKVKDFARSLLPRRNIDLLSRAIQAGLAGRQNVEFIPIFNFLYRDGHEMLTIGGIIGGAIERRKINGSALAGTPYYRDDLRKEPCVIKVPRLTKKERQYLDSEMPCPDNWTPDQFELTWDNVNAYRDIYRFCPSYAELLL
jgi:hypothetical protein